MRLSPTSRRSLLAAHLTFSVGWIGAVTAYVGLGLAGATSTDLQTIRAAWIAMDLTGWYVIVPLASGSLLTGLLLALTSKWGLIRYYWTLVSFTLTTVAVVVLLLHMPTVSSQADLARESDSATLYALGGDLFHATLALGLLLAIQVLNIVKPPGLTPYGWRKQQRRLPQGPRADRPLS